MAHESVFVGVNSSSRSTHGRNACGTGWERNFFIAQPQHGSDGQPSSGRVACHCDFLRLDAALQQQLEGVYRVIHGGGKWVFRRKAVVERENAATDLSRQRGGNRPMAARRAAYISAAVKIKKDCIRQTQVRRREPLTLNFAGDCLDFDSAREPRA
jgi:hypothetical protein